MINLETPKKQAQLIDQAHQLAMNMLRPISRKYDRAEHEYPKELDMLAALIDGRGLASHGDPAMPVWGDALKRTVSGAAGDTVNRQIEALVLYLRGIQQRSGE